MSSQGKILTAIAKNPNGSTVSASIRVIERPLSMVLIGQKIVSKEMDDPYVETCGKACAKKLNVASQTVSTGAEFIQALEKATIKNELSACVYWGHSWNIGLYLQNDQGLYLDSIYNPYASTLPAGAKKLSHIKTSSIKTKPHSLFIFASCGTARGNEELNTYGDSSFAATFADFIEKTKDSSLKEGTSYYKVTVIGATALSNLLQNGTVRTDGNFYRIEKKYEIEKKAIFKKVEEGMWWWKETKKIFVRWKVSAILIDSKLTKLGKVIDPAEIIKKHNPDDTSM